MKIFTSSLYKIILLLVCLAIEAGISLAQPNVLVIVADDMGVDAMRGYHDAQLMATTPTLDSLRQNGLLFENAFAAPKCTPSRAAMLTGKFGVKTGVTGTPSTLDTIHESLFRRLDRQTNGAYANAVIGKWHLKSPSDENHPAEHGVQHFVGVLGSGVADYYSWLKTENGSSDTSSVYATTDLTNEAIAWVNQQTKPWLLWMAHVAPHSPIHTPPAELYTINNPSRSFRQYLAMIEALDAETNRLLNTLSSDDRANTVVVFVGDNGTPNSTLRDYPPDRGKSTLYQGGVRVPFIVSGAGVTRPGQRETAMVHVGDLFATILNLTGADDRTGVYNSLSFAHLLAGESGPRRAYNYTEVSNEMPSGWVMRDSMHKLIAFDTGQRELYRIDQDSFELVNLLAGTVDPDLQAIVDRLENEALIWRTGWSCTDQIQNGDEDDIDCGGSSCTACVSADATAPAWEVQVFPNPASSTLHLTGGDFEVLEIYSMDGRRLHRESGQFWGGAVLDIDKLPAGQLILRVYPVSSSDKPQAPFALRFQKVR